MGRIKGEFDHSTGMGRALNAAGSLLFLTLRAGAMMLISGAGTWPSEGTAEHSDTNIILGLGRSLWVSGVWGRELSRVGTRLECGFTSD